MSEKEGKDADQSYSQTALLFLPITRDRNERSGARREIGDKKLFSVQQLIGRQDVTQVSLPYAYANF